MHIFRQYLLVQLLKMVRGAFLPYTSSCLGISNQECLDQGLSPLSAEIVTPETTTAVSILVPNTTIQEAETTAATQEIFSFHFIKLLGAYELFTKFLMQDGAPSHIKFGSNR